MLLTVPELLLLMVSFLLIAALYSSVGFGGGSSYLALLALFFVSFYVIRSIALFCNMVVVSSTSYYYWKKGYFDFKKFFPFIFTSIPLAFIGARFRLQESIFYVILGVSLIISAFALIWQTIWVKKSTEINSNYRSFLSYVIGGVIGLLSGLVGIGGGIFLAPILNYMKWDRSIIIATLASFFILVNSISGITGLLTKGAFKLPWVEAIGLTIAVFIGGQIGIKLGFTQLTNKGIKIVTAILVLLVGMRVLMVNAMQINF